MVYKCAIIGCGRIGCGFDDNSKLIRTHAGAYYNNSKTILNALCDIDKSKLLKYGKKYHVTNLYTDYKEMLRNEKPELISICTLVDTHYNIVSEAIKNSARGIFLEKPIANSLSNARKINNLCKKNNTTLLIDYQRRFIPIYYKIKEWISARKFGNIQNVTVYYGGGVANTGSHIFDMLYFLFGNVKKINAKKSSNSSHNIYDSNLDIEIIFNNNITCSLRSIDITNYGVLEMDIFGTAGRLIIDMINHTVNNYVISKKKSLVYKQLTPKKFPAIKKIDEPIVNGLKHLLESMSKSKPSPCDGNQGYKSLELVVASLMSARKNKEVRLPLQSLDYVLSSK